ncbi:hypothetical protein QFZ56_003900 [Streptomyces achromogenes]|uniref:Uncharacterized protein n=1 Tax=Streptomyces achromogenes TaxID=67255 RepID=A0ABU0Q2P7_STRAH|nr:hypothetical protein [Streptomyces achromogenes]
MSPVKHRDPGPRPGEPPRPGTSVNRTRASGRPGSYVDPRRQVARGRYTRFPPSANSLDFCAMPSSISVLLPP